MKNLIVGFGIVAVIGLLGWFFYFIGHDIYMSNFFSYQKNDCVAELGRSELEEWEKRPARHNYLFIDQILEVGKSHYLVYRFKEGSDGSLVPEFDDDSDLNVQTEDKWWVNRYWVRINCETLDPIK